MPIFPPGSLPPNIGVYRGPVCVTKSFGSRIRRKAWSKVQRPQIDIARLISNWP